MNVRRRNRIVAAVLCGIWAAAPVVAQDGGIIPPPSADEVAAGAYAVAGGSDGAARVAFTLTDPDGSERRLAYAMLFKRYDEGDIAHKVIFFPEFPPDRKGYSWLGHLAREGTRADDAQWMYLPDLQAVRRVRGAAEDDPFHQSVLARSELSPRPPGLDTHRLAGLDTLNGQSVYVLETTHGPDFPYPRTVRWITRKDFLTLRAEHHAPSGRVARRVDTTWQRVDGKWVWDTVTAVDPDSGARAELVVTDVRVAPGLSERTFSPSALTGSADRYFPAPGSAP